MGLIGDIYYSFRGDGARLQKDAQVEGAKAGTTLGSSMTAGLRKSWGGAEIGKGLVQGLGLAGGLGAAKLLSDGVGFLKDGLVDTVQSAIDFQKAMANVNSISHMTEKQLADTSVEVLKLAGDFGQSAQTMAEGLYDISSSGFQGADAMTVLKAATKGATAGLSTTGESAAGITAVLNAYGQSAGDAADVSDVLFETVNRGVISFPELAQQIGKTTALSAPLGVSLREVAAAASLMTRNGVQAEDAFTQINAVMLSMLQPSKQASDLATELGLDWSAAGLKANGLVKQMQLLIKATGGNETQMATLLGDSRAIRGAFILAKNSGKDFTDELGAMGKAAGATDRAFAEQSKSTAFHIAQMQAKIEAARIEIGNKFLPIIASVADAAVEHLVPALEDVATQIEHISEVGKVAGDVLHGLGVTQGDAAKQGFDFVHAGEDLLAVMNPTKLSETADLFLNIADAIGVDTRAARSLIKSADDSQGAMEGMRGEMEADLHGVDKSLDGVGTSAIIMAQNVGTSSAKAADSVDEMKDKIEDAARDLIDKAFDPIIAHDNLVATNAEIAANRRVIASKNSSKEEVAAAKVAIHSAEKDQADLALTLARAGATHSKAYKQAVKDLKENIRHSTGATKTYLQGVLDKLHEIDHTDPKVTISVSLASAGNKERAAGGPVTKGEPYIVGERRAELFVPETNGRIIPRVPSMAAATTSGPSAGDNITVNLLDRMPVKSVRDIGDGLRMLERRGYLRRRK